MSTYKHKVKTLTSSAERFLENCIEPARNTFEREGEERNLHFLNHLFKSAVPSKILSIK